MIKDKFAKIIVLLTCLVVVAIMLPLQDQSFTDDFAHAQSVRHLLATGQVKISEWSAPTLIFPIIWGAAFSKIFGFSFTTLHLSIIVMLPILAISMYLILREFKVDPLRSLIITLFFISIPWIFQFTFTFMTDIPFLTLELLTLLFYVKGFQTNASHYLVIGSVFASMAFLTRQTGIIFPLTAFFSALITQKERQNTDWWKKPLLILTIPLVTLILYSFWYQNPDNKTIIQIKYEEQVTILIQNIVPFTAVSINSRLQTFSILIHRLLDFISQVMGLFFPIIFFFVLFNFKKLLLIFRNNRRLSTVILITVFIFYAIDILNFRQTYTIGFPLILYQYEEFFPIPWAHLWKFFVVFSVPIWVVLTVNIWKNSKKDLNNTSLFLILAGFGVFIMTIISYFSWEEYIISLLPFAILLLASSTKEFKFSKKAAFVLSVFLILDSLQMAKLRYREEGFVWNKATELIKSGIPYNLIDPDRNIAWYPWFSYENDAKLAIERAGGDKSKANVESETKSPIYFIATKRQLQYIPQDLEKFKIEEFSINSLFVNSKIEVFKNPDGFTYIDK